MAIQRAKTEKNFIKRRFVKKFEVLTFYKSTLFFGNNRIRTTERQVVKLSGAGHSNANVKKCPKGVAGVLNKIKWRTSGAQAREFTVVLPRADVGRNIRRTGL